MYLVQVIETTGQGGTCSVVLEETVKGKNGKELRNRYRKEYPDEYKYLIKVRRIND